MKKILPLIILFLFSFSAIHAEIKGEISEDGTLTISGKNMPNYGPDTTPWYSRRSEIKKVIITDGVTNIGDCAFFECRNLTSVTVPNSVTSMGDCAFQNCSNLTSVEIPTSVTSIGRAAFAGCLSLTSITIPNSVTSIGNAAFQMCSSLTSITIPTSVTSVGEYTFSSCSNLISVTIPNSVTNIGDNAFINCEALTSVTIPNSVTSIGNEAFAYCSALTSVTIPNSVMSIGNFAFGSCKDLTSVTFSGSTPPEFGNDVFLNVDKSIPVYVPANSREAYKDALSGYGFSNIKAIPLFLTGSESYTQNSQIDGIDVSFTRNFSGDWESICLPFSLEYKDWKDDFEVARINGIHQYDDNDDGNIDRTILEFVKMKNDDSVIEPNTPYLIKAKTSGKKTISVENTTLYEAKANQIECTTTTESFIFTGLYKKLSVWSIPQFANGKNYAMYEGNLSEEITTLSNIGPYRWYMTRENRNSAYGINNNNTAKEISIRVVGEEATGIANIQHASPNTQTYDLNGRRVNENNLKPGMYVKNGRKFVVK